jgi:macrodomain Ter protein organizer (MatP/YcbG family)
MPETDLPISLRSMDALAASGVSIDPEAGMIRNVSIMSAGEAMGHGFNIDGVMLSQVAQQIGASGVKMRYKHPLQLDAFGNAMPVDSVGTDIGRVVNARVENGRVRGDMQLGDYAKNVPGLGDVRSYLLALAKEDPSAYGLSVVFIPDTKDETSPMRSKRVLAADVVGEPAANRMGLLSSQPATGVLPGAQPLPKELSNMDQQTNIAQPAPEVAPAPAVQPVPVALASQPEPQAEPDVIALETKRVNDIKSLCNLYGVPEAVATQQIALGINASQAKDAVLQYLKENNKPASTVRVGEDNQRVALREAIPQAIMLKSGRKVEGAHEVALKIKSLSIVDMIRHHLAALGVNDAFMLSRTKVVDLLSPRKLRQLYPSVALAQATGEFDNILADTINKSLRAAYLDAPKTWATWARRTTNPDFKTITRAALSESPNLTAIDDGAGIQYVQLSDTKETYTLAEYNGGIKLTRRAIINDDLDAFSRIPQLQANAAARKEDDVAYAIITANAALADTGLLFNATAVTTAGGHANYTSSGTAMSVASLEVGFNAMFVQKGIKNAAFLELVPKFLLVPSAKAATAAQLINSTVDPSKSNGTMNPFMNRLQIVPSARLQANSGTAWYLMADHGDGQIDTIEVCFLEDEPEPVLTQETDFDTEDVKFKVRHTVAAKAIDFRGMYKNAGA